MAPTHQDFEVRLRELEKSVHSRAIDDGRETAFAADKKAKARAIKAVRVDLKRFSWRVLGLDSMLMTGCFRSALDDLDDLELRLERMEAACLDSRPPGVSLNNPVAEPMPETTLAEPSVRPTYVDNATMTGLGDLPFDNGELVRPTELTVPLVVDVDRSAGRVPRLDDSNAGVVAERSNARSRSRAEEGLRHDAAVAELEGKMEAKMLTLIAGLEEDMEKRLRGTRAELEVRYSCLEAKVDVCVALVTETEPQPAAGAGWELSGEEQSYEPQSSQRVMEESPAVSPTAEEAAAEAAIDVYWHSV